MQASGRVVLASEKGKLLARLRTMERVRNLNRTEVDADLNEEIALVRKQLSIIATLEDLWRLKQTDRYAHDYQQYRSQYATL
jgi:hypothetical protein